jgi:hypothetical protein
VARDKDGADCSTLHTSHATLKRDRVVVFSRVAVGGNFHEGKHRQLSNDSGHGVAKIQRLNTVDISLLLVEGLSRTSCDKVITAAHHYRSILLMKSRA